MTTAALPAVAAQGAQYIDLDPKVEVASIKYKTEEHGKKQKYSAIQASISAPLAQIGAAGTGNASLTFVDYVDYSDKKNNWHRKITQQNLEASSNVHTAFFNALTHAITIHLQKVVQPTQDNKALDVTVPEAVQINDTDLKIGKPKKNKEGAIELVASSALFDCKVTVTQDKKGVTDVKHGMIKLKNANDKKDPNIVKINAVMNALQQKCLVAIAKFKKENEGKKIEKPVQKKEGKGKEGKAPKAEKAGHEHKAKHAEHKKDKHADDKKHHHGHKKQH